VSGHGGQHHNQENAMILPKKIRSLLNGGAAQAGVKGLQEAIAAVEADMAGYQRELAEIPAKCADAALADDGPVAVRALRSREEELYAQLEIVEVQVGRLREKLREQLDLRRRGLIDHHRKQNLEAFEKFVPLSLAAIEANDEIRRAYEAAVRDLGAGDAARLVTNATFQLPGFNWETLDHFVATVRRELEAAASTVPPSLNRKSAPPPQHAKHGPLPIIPHGDLQHGVRLYQTPAPAGQATPKAPSTKPAPGPAHGKVARLPRAPLPEAPPAGMVRCRVLKNEYPDADGRPLSRGDLVDVDVKIARRAVESNAIAFLDDTEASP
jgi:hypothetical protein